MKQSYWFDDFASFGYFHLTQRHTVDIIQRDKESSCVRKFSYAARNI